MRKSSSLTGGDFVSYFLYYAVYQVILWVVHMVVISFSSFFHFILDHNLSMIEEWAFDKSWEISIVAKLVSLFVILKFILIKSETRFIRKEILPKQSFASIPMCIYVVIAFLFGLLMWLGNPVFESVRSFSIIKLLISWFGMIVFYGSDLLVLYSLKKYYHLKRSRRLLQLLFYPVMFYFCSKGIFLNNRNIDSFVIFTMFILMLVAEFERDQFVLPLILLLSIFAPLAIFFGIDPLWGSTYSLFVMQNSYQLSSLFIISTIILYYLMYKKMGHINTIRYSYQTILQFKRMIHLKMKIRRQ